MSANVFEQYQKYYESLITRHKSNCQLENQNQNQEAKQMQPQEQQARANPQQIPQAMSQNPALPQQQQQQQQLLQPVQYMMPVYMQQPSNWPQSDTNMYNRSQPVQQYNPAAVQMQYSPQKLVCQQPQLYYGPDGSGYYFCNDITYGPLQQQQHQPQPQPQSQLPMQPLYTHHPENYNYCQFGATLPTVPADTPNTCVHPVQAQQTTQQTAQPTFKPDVPAEVAAAAALSPEPIAPVAAAPVLLDQTPKKPVFCYPYSVNGFQGGFPCSPCSSCKKAPQPNAATAPAPAPAPSAAAAAAPAAPPACEGNKDCKSGWAPAGTAAAASGEPVSSKADKERDRLPLGVDEPFVVGPTTYQYFFG